MLILVLLLFNRRTNTIVQKIIQSFHFDKIFSIGNNNIFRCFFSFWYKEYSHCFYIPKNKQKILQSFLSILPILFCLHERNDSCGMWAVILKTLNKSPLDIPVTRFHYILNVLRLFSRFQKAPKSPWVLQIWFRIFVAWYLIQFCKET